MLGNILWIILSAGGSPSATLATGLALCITIIGIPLGIASFKMIPISLTPLGHDIVSANGTGYATY
ncbi:YccF domain-containing protein [Yinghuangia aomiensis]